MTTDKVKKALVPLNRGAVAAMLPDVLTSEKSGTVNGSRDLMLVARERHDIGRPHDWGYPVRAMCKPEFLYVRNCESRQRYDLLLLSLAQDFHTTTTSPSRI